MFLNNRLRVLVLIMATWFTSPLMASEFKGSDLKGVSLNGAMKEFFNTNGYVIIKDFFSPPTMEKAFTEYKDMVRSFPKQELGQHFFDTSLEGAQGNDTYFFKSADEMWPFYNSSAKEHSEFLKADLREDENLFNYIKIMNKTGHNIHNLNPFFQDLVVKDPRLIQFTKDLNYDDSSTALYQTTIISKSTVDDSRYNAHQDGTFIGAHGKVLAYWIPLTPSTRENGCLWGIPGSHKLPIEWWYRKTDTESYKCQFYGKEPTWDLREKVYLEVNPGDLLIFAGSFVHGSDPASKAPQGIEDTRVALTYHLGPTKDWDDLIWLKLSAKNTLFLF